MSLTGVMLCSNRRDAALGYLEHGISIIPLQGKRPMQGWEQYQRSRASLEEVQNWWDGQSPNIGVICGSISGNLVVLDLDGESAVAAFKGAFPGLCETLTVQTRQGLHLYYRTAQLTPTTRVLGDKGNFELRSRGLYVVAPPSIHPLSNQPYQIARVLEPMEVEHLRELIIWLESMRPKPTPRRAAPHVPTMGGQQQHQGDSRYVDKQGKPIRNGLAYASYALTSETGRVRGARVGGRAIALNNAAFRMGQLGGRGWIGYHVVQSALLSASAGWDNDRDLNEHVRAKIIRAGFESGMGKAADRA